LHLNRLALVTLGLTSCLLVGCAYSIHPLYEKQKNAIEPSFPGIWSTVDDQGKEELITIQNNTQQAYEAVYVNPETGRPYVYQVHLVRLDDSLFADVFLEGEKRQDGSTGPLPEGAVAVHLILKVTLESDKLGIAALDQRWLKTQIQTGKISIAHEDVDEDTTVFTASAPDLQKLLLGLASTKAAFGETVVFTRKKK
jgi:hypothetical protein